MRRTMALLPPLALLIAPRAALAGIGTTWAFNNGSEVATGPVMWGGTGVAFPFHSLPSLDLRLKKVDLQIHALEFIGGIAGDTLLVGGNILFRGLERPAPGPFTGVVDPGVSIDIAADTDFAPTNLGVMGLARMGVEAQERFGVGVYVVPAVGVGLLEEDFELLVAGSLQFSVWVP